MRQRRSMQLSTHVANDATGDMAVSHALLLAVAAGRLPATARVFQPAATTSFGRRDALEPGFADACRLARAHHTTPVIRLGGGRAAIYGPGSVVFEIIEPAQVEAGVRERFEHWTTFIVGVLNALNVSCTVGALEGEYCPGDFSLHLPGGPKIAGAAQRVTSRAALYTAAILVEQGAVIRRALIDIYAALGLAWDPTTAGAITDVVPAMRAGTVADALVRALPGGLADALPADLLADADRLRRRHKPEPHYEQEETEHA